MIPETPVSWAEVCILASTCLFLGIEFYMSRAGQTPAILDKRATSSSEANTNLSRLLLSLWSASPFTHSTHTHSHHPRQRHPCAPCRVCSRRRHVRRLCGPGRVPWRSGAPQGSRGRDPGRGPVAVAQRRRRLSGDNVLVRGSGGGGCRHLLSRGCILAYSRSRPTGPTTSLQSSPRP
jgi:hypothetical protein